MESWTREQKNDNWKPATTIIDAKLELDVFQKEYDGNHECQSNLVTQGRTAASEVCWLEERIFGNVKNDSTHPVVRDVEMTVGRMEEACAMMEGVVGPRLQRLRDCYQYHLIKQTAGQVCDVV